MERLAGFIRFISGLQMSPRSSLLPEESARSLLASHRMRSVAENKNSDTDFYLSHVAPLNQQHTRPFRYVDMLLLTVLFLEIGGLVRLLLAK